MKIDVKKNRIMLSELREDLKTAFYELLTVNSEVNNFNDIYIDYQNESDNVESGFVIGFVGVKIKVKNINDEIVLVNYEDLLSIFDQLNIIDVLQKNIEDGIFLV